MKKLWLVLVVGFVFAVAPARANDTWDLQDNGDSNMSTTGNELVHGTIQVHDLQSVPVAPPVNWVPDVDCYLVGMAPYSSYEVLVDSTSGDFGTSGLFLDLVLSDGTVVQNSQGVSQNNRTRSLRFSNGGNSSITNRYVRVLDSTLLCAGSCDENDTYRIRFYDTTIAVPRFNNTGTQITVLNIQNPTDSTVSCYVYFFDASGATFNLNPTQLTLAAHAMTAVNTANYVPNVSGSIVIVHDARYGDLAGKAVALESATGFSFDTPFVVKPY